MTKLYGILHIPTGEYIHSLNVGSSVKESLNFYLSSALLDYESNIPQLLSGNKEYILEILNSEQVYNHIALDLFPDMTLEDIEESAKPTAKEFEIIEIEKLDEA